MEKICADLNDQYLELDNVVTALGEAQWFDATPFYGWTIFDQVAHIAFFDQQALSALEQPEVFKAGAARVMHLLSSEGEWPEKINPLLGPDRPQDLLALWRSTRSDLLRRLGRAAPKDRVPWYGPDMSALSFATARLMETWAHTQDVCDALRLRRKPTARIYHVAHLGVSTFAWSFAVRNLPRPTVRPRVELSGPSGERWVWGEPDAAETVTGSAEEFCLVVTQRRNVADTRLAYRGRYVTQWLARAQAFAGIAQEPPAPGERCWRLTADSPCS